MRPLLHDFLFYCALAFAGILARFGLKLGGELPPDDPQAFAAWRRKQLWTVIGELLTIPAFAALWIGIAHEWHVAIELVIPGCLMSGAMGFGFCLDAYQRWLRRRIPNV